VKHIVVIGAGVAGIAAAVKLVEQGCRVTLLEDRPYVGGRARSFVDEHTGDVIDNGQHLLMGCYHNFLYVLRQLGTDHHLEWQPSLRVKFAAAQRTPQVESSWRVQKTDLERETDFINEKNDVQIQPGKQVQNHFHNPPDILDASRFPGKLGVFVGIMRLHRLTLSDKIRAAFLMLLLQLGSKPKPTETCLEFLVRHGQSANLVRRLWEPIILATLNAPIAAAAAVLFTEVMRRAFMGTRTDSTLIIPRVGLSELFSPLQEFLGSRGSVVRTHCRVEELCVKDGRVFAVRTPDETIACDGVVSALPPRGLQKLMPQLVPDSALVPSAIISVYLWFEQTWFTDDFCAVIGTTIQWVFARGNGCVTVTISAASTVAQGSISEIVDHCLAELASVFPGAQNNPCIHSQVIKEKFATTLFTPQAHAERPPARTHIPNLFIAGDWTQTHLPATMEGAAWSGIVAAEESRSF